MSEEIHSYRVVAGLHLWLLSRRDRFDFASPGIRLPLSFTAEAPSARATAVRELLNLTARNTDHYVLAAYYAMLSVCRPFFRPTALAHMGAHQALLVDMAVSYSPLPLLPLEPYKLPILDGKAASRMFFREVSVQRVGDTARITTDRGHSTQHEFTYNNNRLYIQGAESYGIRAAFQKPTWNDGDSFTVVIEPSQYPTDLFARRIDNSHHAMALMTDRGVMEAYAEAASNFDKVGLCAVALALDSYQSLADDNLVLDVDYTAGGSVSLRVGTVTPERDPIDVREFYVH